MLAKIHRSKERNNKMEETKAHAQEEAKIKILKRKQKLQQQRWLGACLVLLSTYDPKSKRVQEFSINSCLALLCSLDGCSITTVEGIGSTKTGFHAIQQRIAGFHGSQCSFCTLGYRPIVDTCKSFAGDVDVEDLGINTFWASSKDANANLLPTYVREADPAFPTFLRDELDMKENLATVHDSNCAYDNLHTPMLALPLHVKLRDASVLEDERLWIQARSLKEAFQAWLCHHENGCVKLVVGNTSAGYYKDQNPRVFIDISLVPELLTLQEASGTLKVGSAITIEELILTLESIGMNNENSNKSVIRGLVSHLRKLGNPHVRHRASVGGNLIMAQQFSFDSDLAPLLLAVGSSLQLVDSGMNRSTQSLEEFLQRGSLESGWLLECIDIPLWSKEMDDTVSYANGSTRAVSSVGSDNDVIAEWWFDSYRAAPRSLGNSLAYINAAFLDKVSDTGSRHEINGMRLAFGAFGQGHAIREHKVEGFLQGSPVNESVLLEATAILKNELMRFVKGTKLSDYKSSVAVSFLFDFFSSYLQAKVPSVLNTETAGECKGIGPFIRNQNERIDSPYLGENSMHKKDSFSITGRQIVPGGRNVGALFDCFSLPENLFATDHVEYVGHPLGVMVADSPQHAKEAAAKVKVEYEVKSSPILCVEEAEAINSYFPSSFSPLKFSVGDIETEFLKADHKIMDGEVRSGSQYFFYMETQTALAVPDEDNCLVVDSSSQSPSIVQASVSACLGIPHHNVRAITRRVGGGFGGKAFRNIVVASACALAAHKLHHPVRMYLDRKTHMVMMCGRHPVKALYSVSFRHDGKVTGLQAKISIDGGWSQDFTYDTRAYCICARVRHEASSLKIFHHDLKIACKDDFDLLTIWNMMLKRVVAKERDIDSFNTSNRWLKRGLSVLPCVYKVHRSPRPARASIFKDGSVVVEVGGIEIGQGLWAKVKQATINGLSQLCGSSKEGLESLNIRIVQADSTSLPHGGLTSSSTTSEGSCEAVMKACQLLVERLMPLKLLKEKDVAGNLSWIDLITLSNASKVDLSAQVHWFPEQSVFAYLTYRVAATEESPEL
ncbi:hypothetical protein L7F22_069246 [Adiantum nelumboides]|nr:hypothetical protein [Adiantum nelumboides]